MATISTAERISATKLRDLLLAEKTGDPTVAVIDVRDDDYIGGHIKGSRHHPSQKLDEDMLNLVHDLRNKPTVIFHCALSQKRGPDAAQYYLRKREEVFAREKRERAAVEAKQAQASAAATTRADGNAENTKTSTNDSEPVKQKVYVLDRGFVGWQELYGEDELLTEGYRKELWKYGYWG